jgi:hypothetical protein
LVCRTTRNHGACRGSGFPSQQAGNRLIGNRGFHSQQRQKQPLPGSGSGAFFRSRCRPRGFFAFMPAQFPTENL